MVFSIYRLGVAINASARCLDARQFQRRERGLCDTIEIGISMRGKRPLKKRESQLLQYVQRCTSYLESSFTIHHSSSLPPQHHLVSLITRLDLGSGAGGHIYLESPVGSPDNIPLDLFTANVKFGVNMRKKDNCMSSTVAFNASHVLRFRSLWLLSLELLRLFPRPILRITKSDEGYHHLPT